MQADPTHCYASTLKTRGWNEKLIAQLLGEPDQWGSNPHYRSGPPSRLFDRERVTQAEAADIFQSHLTARVATEPLKKLSRPKHRDSPSASRKSKSTFQPTPKNTSCNSRASTTTSDSTHEPRNETIGIVRRSASLLPSLFLAHFATASASIICGTVSRTMTTCSQISPAKPGAHAVTSYCSAGS